MATNPIHVRTAKGGTASRVTFDGPFFTGDPEKRLRENVRSMLEQMAQEGEEAVQGQLQPGHGYLSGALHDSIHGRVRSLSGKPWALTGVVSSNLNALIAKSRNQKSGNWHGSYAGFIETGLRINDRVRIGTTVKVSRSGKVRQVGVWQRRRVGTSFRGYHMFRSASRGLQDSKAARLANLTKGME